mgnify:CR=1 FL=1
MKIYTKTGDTGQTALIGGTRVLKSHSRVSAYGTVDELNSWIGLLRDQAVIQPSEKVVILLIQDRLFIMGSLLAADPEKSRMKLPELSIDDVLILETEIDRMDALLPQLKNFILPGGHQSVSFCHLARCICRRAEREVVSLSTETLVDPMIIIYLNRLSDFLFTLARYWSMVAGAEEIPWIPGA